MCKNAAENNIRDLPDVIKTMPDTIKNDISKDQWLELCNKVVGKDVTYLPYVLENIPDTIKNDIPKEEWLELCNKVVEKDAECLFIVLNRIPYDILLSDTIQQNIVKQPISLSNFVKLTDKSDITAKIHHLYLMLKSGYNDSNSEESKKQCLSELLKDAMSDNLFLPTLSANISQANSIIYAIKPDVLLKKGILYEESIQNLYTNGIGIEKLLRIHADKLENSIIEIKPNIVIRDKNSQDVTIETMSDLLFVYQYAPDLLKNTILPDACKKTLQDKYTPFSSENPDTNCITNAMKTCLITNKINVDHYFDIKYVLPLYEKIIKNKPIHEPKNNDIKKIINNKAELFGEQDQNMIKDKLLNSPQNINLLTEISQYCDDGKFTSIIDIAIDSTISSANCGANIGVLLDNELKTLQFNDNKAAEKFHSFISSVAFSIFNSKQDVIGRDGHINNSHIKENEYYVNMDHLLYNIGLKTEPVPSHTDQLYSDKTDDLHSPHIKIGAKALLGMLSEKDKDLLIYTKLTNIVETINEKMSENLKTQENTNKSNENSQDWTTNEAQRPSSRSL